MDNNNNNHNEKQHRSSKRKTATINISKTIKKNGYNIIAIGDDKEKFARYNYSDVMKMKNKAKILIMGDRGTGKSTLSQLIREQGKLDLDDEWYKPSVDNELYFVLSTYKREEEEEQEDKNDNNEDNDYVIYFFEIQYDNAFDQSSNVTINSNANVIIILLDSFEKKTLNSLDQYIHYAESFNKFENAQLVILVNKFDKDKSVFTKKDVEEKIQKQQFKKTKYVQTILIHEIDIKLDLKSTKQRDEFLNGLKATVELDIFEKRAFILSEYENKENEDEKLKKKKKCSII